MRDMTKKSRSLTAVGRSPTMTIRIPAPLLTWIDEKAAAYETGRSDMVWRLIEESSLGVPHELRTIRIAYHEAAHAVVARTLGVAVDSATIKSDQERLGAVRYASPHDVYGKRREDWPEQAYYSSIMINLAGLAAEMKLLHIHRRDQGNRSDWRRANKDINQVSQSRSLQSDRRELKSIADTLKFQLRLLTEDLVEVKLRRSIKGVAEALLGSQTIGQDQIDRIIGKSGELPDARRFVVRRWESHGLARKTRRSRNAPRRRATD